MLANYLSKHEIDVKALATASSVHYPPPAPSEQPIKQAPAPSVDTAHMSVSPLLATALASMAPQATALPSISTARAAPTSTSLLLQGLGMPVLPSRFSQPTFEPVANANAPTVLASLLSVPTDPGVVRIEHLQPELQQVLVPMFIAWLQRLLGAQ